MQKQAHVLTFRRAAGFSQRRKIPQCAYSALPGLKEVRGSPDKNRLFFAPETLRLGLARQTRTSSAEDSEPGA